MRLHLGRRLEHRDPHGRVLTLLHLGLKNIYLGPTLPAFLSPNVLDYLIKTFDIHPTTTPEQDLKAILG